MESGTAAVTEVVGPVGFFQRPLPRQIAAVAMVVGAGLVCASVFHPWVKISSEGVVYVTLRPGVFPTIEILALAVANLFVALRVMIRVVNPVAMITAWAMSAINIVALILLQRFFINKATPAFPFGNVGAGTGFFFALAGVAVVLVAATLVQVAMARRE